MKANLGLLPVLGDGLRRNRRERAAAHAKRALEDLEEYVANARAAHSHNK